MTPGCARCGRVGCGAVQLAAQAGEAPDAYAASQSLREELTEAQDDCDRHKLRVGDEVWQARWTRIGEYEIRAGRVSRIRGSPMADNVQSHCAEFPTQLHWPDEVWQNMADGPAFSRTRRQAVEWLADDMRRQLERATSEGTLWELAIRRLERETAE